MSDTGGLTVSADKWEDTTLRFDTPADSDRVADTPTPFSELEVGDVVVVDLGELTGNSIRSRRSESFNKTAHRVCETGFKPTCRLAPSDGRAAPLTVRRGRGGVNEGDWTAWAESRVGQDAKAYRVLVDR